MSEAAEKATTMPITEVSQERAYEIIAELEDSVAHETKSLLAVRGRSAEFGVIYVVIEQVLGNSLLLPFASQAALL